MTFVTKSNGRYNTNDDVFTPVHIAKKIISWLPIKDNETLYDPFRGLGAFYDNFPVKNKKYWSEIKESEDFFEFNTKVDWIISNPPYSKYTEVMNHSYELADNIVYLIPLNKIGSSFGRLLDLQKYGGIIKMWIMPACKCGFPFGFPACVCWFKKGYKGKIDYEIIKDVK